MWENYQDPYGEFEHVHPVDLEQAVYEMKEAGEACQKLEDEIIEQNRILRELDIRWRKATKHSREKEYQLLISARAHTPTR